MTNTERNKIS